MSEAVFGPIITLLCTGLFGWRLARGFATGTMKLEQAAVTLSGNREDQPIRFWAVATLLGVLTIGSALATIGQIFFPDGVGR